MIAALVMAWWLALAQPADLSATLESLDVRVAAVSDLEAEFEQRKSTPLLRRQLVSSGRVRVKGDAVRWDTLRPHRSVTLLVAKELRIYYPDQAALEVYELSGDLARLASSPLPRLDALRMQFEIERLGEGVFKAEGWPLPEQGLALRLTPRAESVREHLCEVRVLIDTEKACLSRMEMTDADGETTLLLLRSVQLNTGLGDLSIDVPAGTAVSRPLGGGNR